MTTTHTLTIGPLSLLAEQHGPLLSITIHAPSDSAPVGKMALTVPEWTALVALVDSLAVADRRHAEDRAALEAMRERSEYHEMLRTILSACDDSTRASIGKDAPLRAVRKVIAERDSLRQQVRELTEERDAYRRAKQENDERFMTERDQARSDLSAALVSVDAMAERIEQMRPVYERAVEWRERSYPNARSWIVQPRDAALVSAIDTALAHVAREKETSKS